MAPKDKQVHGVPRLPNIEEFRLKNILNTIEDGPSTKLQIIDSILKISQNYSNDQTAQIEQLYQVEQNEVLKRLDSISSTYSIVHNKIDTTYKEISNMSSSSNNNNSRGGLHGIPLLGSYTSGSKNQNHSHNHNHNHNHHHGHSRSRSSGTLASPPPHGKDESYLSKLNKMSSKGIGNGNSGGVSSTGSLDAECYDITGISYDLQDITNMMLESKERVNNIVNKLKKIEKKLPVKDKLFSFSSPHKEHYSDLHKFGMRGAKKSTNLSKLKDHILSKSTPLDNKNKGVKEEDSLNVKLVEKKTKFQSTEGELYPNQNENDVIDDDSDDDDDQGGAKESRDNNSEDSVDVDMESPNETEGSAATLSEAFKNLITNSNRKSVIINPTMSLFSPIVSSFDPVTSLTSIGNNSTKDGLVNTESSLINQFKKFQK